MRRAVLPAFSRCAILIVDDRPESLAATLHALRAAGYNRLETASDSSSAVATFIEWRPDLIIVNLDGRELDGLAVLTRLANAFDEHTAVPVLVMTGSPSSEKRRLAASLGADDVLRLPPDAVEFELRIRAQLELRLLRLKDAAPDPPDASLPATQLELLERLALIAEYRDDDTGLHTARIGAWSAAISEALGDAADEVELLRHAAPLHDIGKIGIPDHVLLKEGPLTPAERNIMQSHTTIGADILKRSNSPVLQLARQIALCHHERWDGLGYPIGMKANQSPRGARIVAVVDTFDALIQKRPYKPAWSQYAALQEMRTQRGRQFDPEILDTLVALVERDTIREIGDRLRRTA